MNTQNEIVIYQMPNGEMQLLTTLTTCLKASVHRACRGEWEQLKKVRANFALTSVSAYKWKNRLQIHLNFKTFARFLSVMS